MTALFPPPLLSVATARALRAPVEVPATPDADSARRAAAEELSKPVYRHQANGLWERIWQWLTDHLDLRSAVPGAPPWLSVLLVAVLVIALLAALVVLVTRITWARRAARTGAPLFEDDRDAAALARAADAAAGQGDWATAVVERFRAVVRSLDERGAIEDYPGMTAHEAARLASGPLAELAGQMDEAARLFDAVRYGRIEPTSAQDTWMRDFADQVARAVLVPASQAERVIA
ncbi:DUF4129 domain-containing protein [Actinomyces sp.]|uniref:DUF4129 domain-containing protein n=1 Tax=Actinomyces sp. TaxID=29317 RepID=UPI0026DB2E7C|nr:DUF4129 domain-containing protein [Actinomyces sp.]MDO4899406.1 DUF4129 domain-containing protein [Actinomyces sp.]